MTHVTCQRGNINSLSRAIEQFVITLSRRNKIFIASTMVNKGKLNARQIAINYAFIYWVICTAHRLSTQNNYSLRWWFIAVKFKQSDFITAYYVNGVVRLTTVRLTNCCLHCNRLLCVLSNSVLWLKYESHKLWNVC